MHKLFVTLTLGLSFAAQANVDCLRFMGKKAELKWSKTCNVILEDRSHDELQSIDACFGKYSYKNKDYIVLNADILKKSGFVKKDSLIVSGALGVYAEELNSSISIDKKTASPELLKRYRYVVNFDKVTDVLSVQKYQGLFRLSKTQDLKLECK
jgi:hypothetical protein